MLSEAQTSEISETVLIRPQPIWSGRRGDLLVYWREDRAGSRPAQTLQPAAIFWDPSLKLRYPLTVTLMEIRQKRAAGPTPDGGVGGLGDHLAASQVNDLGHHSLRSGVEEPEEEMRRSDKALRFW